MDELRALLIQEHIARHMQTLHDLPMVTPAERVAKVQRAADMLTAAEEYADRLIGEYSRSRKKGE